MFVARDKEPAALSRMYEKLGFQMAVVYGRRCVRNRGEKHCRPISESNANPSAFSGFSARTPRGNCRFPCSSSVNGGARIQKRVSRQISTS